MSDVVQYSSSDTAEISLSEAANHRILTYLAEQSSQKKGIRLSVKKTGCSGLSYVIDYIEVPMDGDIILSLDCGYLLSIDKASYPYLKGMHIDFVKQGLNQKFIFNNPNQTGQCGCGESFTVD